MSVLFVVDLYRGYLPFAVRLVVTTAPTGGIFIRFTPNWTQAVFLNRLEVCFWICFKFRILAPYLVKYMSLKTIWMKKIPFFFEKMAKFQIQTPLSDCNKYIYLFIKLQST